MNEVKIQGNWRYCCNLPPLGLGNATSCILLESPWVHCIAYIMMAESRKKGDTTDVSCGMVVPCSNCPWTTACSCWLEDCWLKKFYIHTEQNKKTAKPHSLIALVCGTCNGISGSGCSGSICISCRVKTIHSTTLGYKSTPTMKNTMKTTSSTSFSATWQQSFCTCVRS